MAKLSQKYRRTRTTIVLASAVFAVLGVCFVWALLVRKFDYALPFGMLLASTIPKIRLVWWQYREAARLGDSDLIDDAYRLSFFDKDSRTMQSDSRLFQQISRGQYIFLFVFILLCLAATVAIVI